MGRIHSSSMMLCQFGPATLFLEAAVSLSFGVRRAHNWRRVTAESVRAVQVTKSIYSSVLYREHGRFTILKSVR